MPSDRERAHALLASWRQPCMHPQHNTDCDALVKFAAEVRAETYRVAAEHINRRYYPEGWTRNETQSAIANDMLALSGDPRYAFLLDEARAKETTR